MAIVGLAMATYATIDLIIKHTDWVANTLTSRRSLQAAKKNLEGFEIQRTKRELRQQLDIAHRIQQRSHDEKLKEDLEESFKDIQVSLNDAARILEERSLLDPSRNWFLRTKKNVLADEVNVALKKLKAARDTFGTITGNYALQTHLPSLVFLSSEDFQVIQQVNASLPQKTMLVDADLARGDRGPPPGRGRFLLELRETLEENVRGMAETLALARNVPAAADSSHGVLTCIGYRRVDDSGQTSNKYHLVFALPRDCRLDNNLQRLIQDSAPNSLPPSLNQRIDLCYQLSNAVLQVHKLKLVHKNVNTVNILIMRPTSPSPVTPAPPHQAQVQAEDLTLLLSDWHLVRHAENASSFMRDSDWWKRLYQHPSRHLLHIEEKYTMYHDIYSLGVCMTEILLWESLLVISDVQGAKTAAGNQTGTPVVYSPSPLLQGVANDVLNAPEEKQSVEVVGLDGQMIQDITIKIARTRLPSAVGTKLTEIVVNCLKCLDGSFGEISFSGDSILETTSNFMTTIQKDIWDLKVAL